MNTIIKCPYCRDKIPISRKMALGSEILEDVYCPHCKRSMDIQFDERNLPYLLAYFEEGCLQGIRIKASDAQKHPFFEIEYHEDSIDALTNIWYESKDQMVRVAKCANCGAWIRLNQEVREKEVFGLFCNSCAIRTKFRFSYEFLSNFYDAEQAQLKEKETENQQDEEKQEEKSMTSIKSTIIGFVMEEDGRNKIYNPTANQLAEVSKSDFESMCLGEFPYRRIRANTLKTGEVVETLDGKVYYVSDAGKNELFDFVTGKIERSAVVTNLMVNTNCYVKYVPVLKKYTTIADIAAGNVDPRFAKMIEVISNDVQTGNDAVTGGNNILAKMVRFVTDPEYGDLLDIENLHDMILADPQALMVMSQMTTMQMSQAIISGGGSIPLKIRQEKTVQQPENTENSQMPEEEIEACRQRLTDLMNEAVRNGDYVTAGEYQKKLKDLS